MQQTTDAIKIVPTKDNSKLEISVLVSTIEEPMSSGNVKITIPSLGDIFTIAKNDNDDKNEAINELVQSFFEMCNKKGNGIRTELINLKWLMNTDTVLQSKSSNNFTEVNLPKQVQVRLHEYAY